MYYFHRTLPLPIGGINVKKIASLAAALALSAGLLVGCTSINEPRPVPENLDAEQQAELVEMREANDLHAIFSKHVLVNRTTETWGVVDGEEIWQGATRTQYNSAGAGISYYSVAEQEQGIAGVTATYGDDVTSFAMYTVMPDIDNKMIGVYPASEYETIVCGQWLSSDPEVEEVVVASSIDDAAGVKTLTTETVYESAGIRIEINYYIDIESGLLSGYDETTYDLASEDVLGVSRSNIWYDEPIDQPVDPVAAIRQADELCTLTFVINPGQENEETQTFTVAKGTTANIVSANTYGMFADAECTQPLAEVVATDAEATVYAKLAE